MPIDEIRKYERRAAELGLFDPIRAGDLLEIRAHQADLNAMIKKRQELRSMQGDFSLTLSERISAGDSARRLTEHILHSQHQRRIDRARVESALRIHEGCLFRPMSGREKRNRLVSYLTR